MTARADAAFPTTRRRPRTSGRPCRATSTLPTGLRRGVTASRGMCRPAIRTSPSARTPGSGPITPTSRSPPRCAASSPLPGVPDAPPAVPYLKADGAPNGADRRRRDDREEPRRRSFQVFGIQQKLTSLLPSGIIGAAPPERRRSSSRSHDSKPIGQVLQGEPARVRLSRSWSYEPESGADGTGSDGERERSRKHKPRDRDRERGEGPRSRPRPGPGPGS